MNLKQLEVFVSIVESGSFSRGAEKTFLTQSTVSQHVAALESEFGLRLLDRTGKGASPTEAGKTLLQHARRILAETGETTRAMDRLKGLESGELKLGGSNIPGNYMIPCFLPLFHRHYPGVTVILSQGDSSEILEKLRQEDMELAVIGCRYDSEGIAFTPLGPDDIVLVAGGSHRWKGREEVRLDELFDEPFIFREKGSGTDRTVREALSAAGAEPGRLKVHACLGSNEAVKQAVIGGFGISFVSEISVRKECARGELFQVRVGGLSISRSFYLAAREGRELSPAAKAFSALLAEQYGNARNEVRQKGADT